MRILWAVPCRPGGAGGRLRVQCSDPPRTQLMALSPGTSIGHYGVTHLALLAPREGRYSFLDEGLGCAFVVVGHERSDHVLDFQVHDVAQ